MRRRRQEGNRRQSCDDVFFLDATFSSRSQILASPSLSLVNQDSWSLVVPRASQAMASFRNSVRLFKASSTHLLKNFFTCHQCLRNQSNISRARIRYFPFSGSFKGTFSPLRRVENNVRNPSNVRTTLYTTARSFEHVAVETQSGFPSLSDKTVAYWLLGSAASVFGIVIFGGLTRLTESG
jgi:heme a synthase